MANIFYFIFFFARKIHLFPNVSLICVAKFLVKCMASELSVSAFFKAAFFALYPKKIESFEKKR